MNSYSLKEILVAFSEGLENHTLKNAKLIKEAIYLLSQYESNPTKENKEKFMACLNQTIVRLSELKRSNQDFFIRIGLYYLYDSLISESKKFEKAEIRNSIVINAPLHKRRGYTRSEYNPNELNVDRFDFVVKGEKETLATGNLGPCIGLVIFDKELDLLFLGHFVNLKCSDFSEFFETVNSSYRDISKLDVIVRGGRNQSGNPSMRNRETVINMLRKYKFNNINIKWAKDNAATNIVYDPNIPRLICVSSYPDEKIISETIF